MHLDSFRDNLPFVAEATIAAREMGHEWVAPEHLLLALSRNGQGVVRDFFGRIGMTPEAVQVSLETVLGSMVLPRSDGLFPVTQRAHVALECAIAAAEGHPNPYSAEDLLRALLDDSVAANGVVQEIFARGGMSLSTVRSELAAASSGVAAT